MRPEVIQVHTLENLDASLIKAAKIISCGGIVAVPTESFYGLAVDATSERAIERLLEVKQRPSDNPILILIPAITGLERYVRSISEKARQLMARFWPGGLTLVFEAGVRISPLLTAGTGKIGIRLSGHPVPAGLAHAAGVPITGTSANLSGKPACLSVEAIKAHFGKDVDLILDGGKTAGGRGSTVLDVTVHPPRIIREGVVSRDQLRDFLQDR